MNYVKRLAGVFFCIMLGTTGVVLQASEYEMNNFGCARPTNRCCSGSRRKKKSDHTAVINESASWDAQVLYHLENKCLTSELTYAAMLCVRHPHIALSVLRTVDKNRSYEHYWKECDALPIIEEDAEFVGGRKNGVAGDALLAMFFDRTLLGEDRNGDERKMLEEYERVEVAALVIACAALHSGKSFFAVIKESATFAAIPIAMLWGAYMLFNDQVHIPTSGPGLAGPLF